MIRYYVISGIIGFFVARNAKQTKGELPAALKLRHYLIAGLLLFFGSSFVGWASLFILHTDFAIQTMTAPVEGLSHSVVVAIRALAIASDFVSLWLGFRLLQRKSGTLKYAAPALSLVLIGQLFMGVITIRNDPSANRDFQNMFLLIFATIGVSIIIFVLSTFRKKEYREMFA